MTLRTHARRGVTLLEGLISTVILLTGMIGVLQGVTIASQQNSMANRHTRASIIAQELITAIESRGRARNLVAGSGLFVTPQCQPFSSLPTTPIDVQQLAGELNPVPPSFTTPAPGLGWPSVNVCYINFDGLAASYTGLTPGYTTFDNTIYSRVVAVYTHPSNNEVLFVGVNVGWRDGGRVRNVKRTTAIYDTTTNQTNLEF